MKTELIKAIFTNLLFVIGVVLVIIGFAQGTQTVVKLLVMDQYPLPSYEETRCEVEQYSYAPTAAMVKEPAMMDGSEASNQAAAPSSQEMADRFNRCQEKLEVQRQTKLVEDIVSAITMFISGTVLVIAFRKFIFG